jgi:hypothetical protein
MVMVRGAVVVGVGGHGGGCGGSTCGGGSGCGSGGGGGCGVGVGGGSGHDVGGDGGSGEVAAVVAAVVGSGGNSGGSVGGGGSGVTVTPMASHPFAAPTAHLEMESCPNTQGDSFTHA